MNQEYYYRSQVIELFDCDEDLLGQLEAEALVRPTRIDTATEPVFPIEQVERIRIIVNLMQDMEVNLPGCEVILRLRENMIEMQRQFDQILEVLAEELRCRNT